MLKEEKMIYPSKNVNEKMVRFKNMYVNAVPSSATVTMRLAYIDNDGAIYPMHNCECINCESASGDSMCGNYFGNTSITVKGIDGLLCIVTCANPMV